MRALKALVAVLGIAVVVAATVLVTVIAQRAGGLRGAPVTASVPLPDGARIVETRMDGGRILLRMTLPNADERLLILDAATGESVATYDLTAGGGPR